MRQIATFLLLLTLGGAPASAASVKALVGGRLIDGHGGRPLENSVVLIEGSGSRPWAGSARWRSPRGRR